MLDFYIPHRQKNEKIILLLRRHVILILAKIIFWAIVAIMPFLLYLILGKILLEMFNSELMNAILILFVSVYYLFVWLFAFHSFVDYYLDVWIITNRRIINMEQNGLFSRTVSEQKLYRIQDVTSKLIGFYSTIFDYGDVHVQTAGEEQRFIFKQVPKPFQVAKKINQLAEENKKFESVISGEDKVHLD